MSLVTAYSEWDAVRRAAFLWTALGGELNLSHTTLDQGACGALAQMLEFSEGLTELDLSHCELTDELLLMLVTHLHKVQVLEWVSDCIMHVFTWRKSASLCRLAVECMAAPLLPPLAAGWCHQVINEPFLLVCLCVLVTVWVTIRSLMLQLISYSTWSPWTPPLTLCGKRTFTSTLFIF